ncbi:hypothetical protein [Desulfovibrio sp. ZJ369]|uniref:hypothetical protein n=1 Tax=Desulfovibrio sp. ZJ369 TaxID=2709793 RepID=UPI001F150B1B|nr:hypothetical protein [Desulfovibrio sp. ZJ369]
MRQNKTRDSAAKCLKTAFQPLDQDTFHKAADIVLPLPLLCADTALKIEKRFVARIMQGLQQLDCGIKDAFRLCVKFINNALRGRHFRKMQLLPLQIGLKIAPDFRARTAHHDIFQHLVTHKRRTFPDCIRIGRIITRYGVKLFLTFFEKSLQIADALDATLARGLKELELCQQIAQLVIKRRRGQKNNFFIGAYYFQLCIALRIFITKAMGFVNDNNLTLRSFCGGSIQFSTGNDMAMRHQKLHKRIFPVVTEDRGGR